MKNVITVSRQKGSGGRVIASEVAVRLGWRLVGRELVSEAASEAGLDESKIERVFEKRLSLQDRMTFQQKSAKYVDAVEKVVKEQVSQGNVVILGRGANLFIPDDPRVFRVHLVADFDTRIRRVTAQCKLRGNKGEDEARRLVNESDYARAAFFNYLFGVDWNDPLLYEMVLNTTDLTVEQAAEAILGVFGVLNR